MGIRLTDDEITDIRLVTPYPNHQAVADAATAKAVLEIDRLLRLNVITYTVDGEDRTATHWGIAEEDWQVIKNEVGIE